MYPEPSYRRSSIKSAIRLRRFGRSLPIVEAAPMPRYHFDLVDSKTVADEGGQELPDDATAKQVAKEIAARLRKERPQLKNHNFAILVTNGERIFRAPIDLANWPWAGGPPEPPYLPGWTGAKHWLRMPLYPKAYICVRPAHLPGFRARRKKVLSKRSPGLPLHRQIE